MDNTAPTVSLSNTGTTSSITVTATASDTNSGVNTYSYAIKQGSGNYGNAVTDGSSHTFSGLTQGTTYTIRVIVTDKAGNSTTRETSAIQTGTLPSGNDYITSSLSPNTWTNGNVTVTLAKSSSLQNPNNYTLQYRIGTGGTWTNYTAPLVRSDNTTIYARLIDVAGNSSGAKTITFTWIDKNAPTLSARSARLCSSSQEVSVRVTGSDTGTSGFAANQSLKYAWSTSSTTAPTSFTTIPGTNTAGVTSLNFTVPGRDLNGTYYLWIQAGSLADRAGNKTAVAHYGPYIFDNTAPTPSFGTNGSTTWRQSHSTTVTASDATTLKYMWTQSTTAPSDIATNGTTFESGETITKDSVTGNNWYLWIYAVDSAGNSSTTRTNPFYLDNTNPTVSFGTNGSTTYKKSQSTVVTVTDVNSNINTSSAKYMWTQSITPPTEENFNTSGTGFSSNTTITKSTGTGNNWYLWVMVKDNAGNTVITKSNVFYLDNTLPTVAFAPNGNTTYAKSQSTKVTVSDSNSGVNTGSLKYQWTQSSSAPSTSSFSSTFTNGGTIKKSDGTGDNWFLWILAQDSAGNQTITKSNVFYLDNTAPTVSLSNTGTTSSITVTATASDTNSGVNTYSYAIKQGSGNYGSAVTDGRSHTFSGLTQGSTYTIRVIVTDKAGNSTTRETGTITTGTVPSGDSNITISLNPNTWTKNNITVTMSKASSASSYTLQYRIGTSGNWTNYTAAFTLTAN